MSVYSVGKIMRKQVLSHISGTSANWYLVYGKKFGNISPSKIHMHLLFNSAILLLKIYVKDRLEGFPGGAVVENLPANAGDTGSSPGLGGSHMPRSN